jgi:hypothetical protein
MMATMSGGHHALFMGVEVLLLSTQNFVCEALTPRP